jgi:glyoxylase-like metal-dependent hydrolase (beta-lactamase superfamily II)
VEHPGVGAIIIDTGFHPSVAVDPKQNLGPVYGRIYRIDMRPEQAIPAQLREQKGIEPQDVRVAIMTHLHMDHASAISEFTSATYVLGMGEWRAFHSSRFALNGYVRHHVQHAVEYKEVPYDSPVIDSYGTFGRSFDLFGDGSVRLVYTPGHTHGHQSVILRLKDREALVAGDAIYFLETLDDERRGWAMADEHKWRRSIGEVRLYRRENPDALIIPGHDPDAWSRLASQYQ